MNKYIDENNILRDDKICDDLILLAKSYDGNIFEIRRCLEGIIEAINEFIDVKSETEEIIN